VKHLKPVKVYLESDTLGGYLVWWQDPRDKTPSMKYPVLERAFVNLVEKFRYEGMRVQVNKLGKEISLEPTQSPKYQYAGLDTASPFDPVQAVDAERTYGKADRPVETI
jgi:hypothetical protein